MMGRKHLSLLFFLLAGLARLYGAGASNDSLILKKKITLSRANVSLQQVLADIESGYHISFSYADNLIPLDRKISLEVKEQPLHKVLDQLFKDMPVAYQVVGKQIVLTRATPVVAPPATVTKSSPPAPAIRQDSGVKINTGKQLAPAQVSNDEDGDDHFITGRRKRKGSKGKIPARRGKEKMTITLGRRYARPPVDTSDIGTDSLESKRKHVHKPAHKLQASLRKAEERKYSIDLTIDAGSSFRTIRSVSREGDEIMTERGGEKPGLGFASRLCFTWHLSRNFALGSGLGFISNGIKGYQSHVDSNYMGDDRSWQKNYSNRIVYLYMPLQVEFSYPVSSFFIRVQGSLLPSLFAGSSDGLGYYNYSYYREYHQEPYWRQRTMMPPQEVTYRKTNLGLSVHAAIEYSGPKFGVSAGPSYTGFLFSTYPKSAPLKEKVYMVGFAIRLRYFF